MIGLVLQGGGAKGGYHIGVWQALREIGIQIGAVTGTSVGALNGAMIVQDDFKKAFDIWNNMEPGLVIKGDPEIYQQLVTHNFQIKNWQMYYDYLRQVIKQKGLDIEPLIKLINQIVDEERLRNSNIDFGLVTISLSDWKAIELFIEDIEEGKIKDYMLASAFLPAFKPQMIHGKRYLDGGFHDSMPINLMSKKGYSEIVAVELRSMGMIRHTKDKHVVIRTITPSGDTGSMLEFDRDISRDNIKMGYLDTMLSYGKYEGSSYFMTEVPTETFFYEAVLALTDEQIMAMACIGGYKYGYPKRLLHEKIVPDLCEMMGLGMDQTYKDIMLGAIETIAASMEIPRLVVYTYEDLLSLVKEKCRKAPKKTFDFEMLPELLRRRTMIKNNFKAELLIRWMGISSNIFEQEEYN